MTVALVLPPWRQACEMDVTMRDITLADLKRVVAAIGKRCPRRDHATAAATNAYGDRDYVYDDSSCEHAAAATASADGGHMPRATHDEGLYDGFSSSSEEGARGLQEESAAHGDSDEDSSVSQISL